MPPTPLRSKAAAPARPFTKETFGHDFGASIVVFLVALPLCMGIAKASGIPDAQAPLLGILTGIIGGIVVGSIAGSPLQVSGPAAGLAVLIAQLVEQYGLPALGVAVLGGGVLQLAAGVLKLGRWFRAVSPSVIGGMLAGIGVLIFGSQFHVMVDDNPRQGTELSGIAISSGLNNLLSIPEAVVKGIAATGDLNHRAAAIVGLVTIAVIVLWTPGFWGLFGLGKTQDGSKPGGVFRVMRIVPAPLLAVVVATAAALFDHSVFGHTVKRIEIPDDLFAGLNVPTLDVFGLLTEPGFLGEVLAIGLIASAETLLCASAVDRMHSGPRTNYDKELVGQGVGNILCGCLGALPMTGVIVRSSANVEAGGQTRASAILHGFWLLGLVVALPFVLELIPMSALGAILVYTGFKLAGPDKWKNALKRGAGELIIFSGTVFAIVATDLLKGVVFGFVLALVKLLWTMSLLQVHMRDRGDSTEGEHGNFDVFLRGAATFVRLPMLAETLEKVPPERDVHLHVGGLAYIDHACMDLMNDWQTKYEADGGSVHVEWDDARARHANTLVDGPATGANAASLAPPAQAQGPSERQEQDPARPPSD